MEKKIVLRAELPKLKGKSITEGYKYFRDILGEADEVDIYEDNVEYFSYHEEEIQPVTDYNGNWGIDYVLHHSSEYAIYIGEDFQGLLLKDFKEKANKLSELFNIQADTIKLLAYDWYNGGDEPISF